MSHPFNLTLSTTRWETDSNPLLVDYRSYKKTGDQPGAARRTWTLVANLTATIAWGILSAPFLLVTLASFCKIKNRAWSHACERGNFTKASFTALRHFEPAMDALRSLEARAYYSEHLKLSKIAWSADNQQWTAFNALCARLSPAAFEPVYKGLGESPERVPFLKALHAHYTNPALQKKVRQELYQLGWMTIQPPFAAGHFFSRQALEEVIQRRPKFEAAVKHVAHTKGADPLDWDLPVWQHFQKSLGKMQWVQEVKAAGAKLKGVPAKDPAWDKWQQQLRELKASQMVQLANELAIDYQDMPLLNALRSALEHHREHSKHWIKPGRLAKIQARIDTLQERTFAAGTVTNLIETQTPSHTFFTKVSWSCLFYPKALFEILQRAQPAKQDPAVKEVFQSQGKKPLCTTKPGNRSDLQDLLEGHLEWWLKRDRGGNILGIHLDGFKEVVELGKTAAPVYTLIETLFNELAPEILAKRCPSLLPTSIC